MKTMTRNLCLFMMLAIIYMQGIAQNGIDSAVKKFEEIPAKYFNTVSKKAGVLEGKLDKQSSKTLRQYEKYQSKLLKKLSKTDSLAAKNISVEMQGKYAELREKLKAPQQLQQYIPSLDSMSNSLKFLDKYGNIGSKSKELQNSLTKVNDLKDKLQQAENIKQFLEQQKEYVKENLKKFGERDTKQLKQLNKQAYYYTAQLKEYKETLKDQKKIERKTLELLSQTNMYKDFMKKNSMLASLFRLPSDDLSDPASLESIAGLQTRAQVEEIVNTRVSAGGAGGQQAMQQGLQQANSQLRQLKNKVQSYGNSNNDEDMPDFKPNPQKTKSFLQRIELGTNMQTQKSNSLMPVASDIGLSAGYKLNDKSIIGIGASYRMGWGSSIRAINITHQGTGLRSFADMKLKKSFWLSGGYELNHQAAFKNIEELKDMNSLQQSGLIGISKKVSLKTKFLSNTKMQLFWDFLSYQQIPRTQPLVFRMGYSLK